MDFKNLPVSFTIVDEVQSNDTRFLDVVIDVLHTGLNLNGSVFEKEVVDEALSSIKNTPILGYITKDDDGTADDFAGHEYKLAKSKDGKMHRYVYSGSAYGVIPESCHPRWVTKSYEGQTREYLQVNGLLWTKFDDAIEIFKRDVIKGQSMELADNYEGVENDNGTFTFTKFRFDGCCILSTSDPHIQPAMVGANVMAQFTADTIANEIKQKLNEYASVKYKGDSPAKTKEGGKTDLNKEFLDVLAKYNVEPESLDFSFDGMSLDEFEEKVKVFAKSNDEGEPDGEPENNGEPAFSENGDGSEPDCENGESAPANFALVGDIREALCVEFSKRQIVDEFWGVCPEFLFFDFDMDKEEVYATGFNDGILYGFKYEMHGDRVEIDFESKKRMKMVVEEYIDGDPEPPVFEAISYMKDAADRVFEEKLSNEKAVFENALSAKNAEFNELNEKYEALSAEKDARIAADLKAQKDEVFSMFSKEIGSEADFAALKDDAENYSVEEITNKCYAILGKKKANFSVDKSKGSDKTLRIPGSVPVIPSPYGDLFN